MQWPKQGALLLTVSLGWTLLHAASATAQPSLNEALVNGGMEEIQNDRPKGWIFNSSAGGVCL